jgi:hypothetical protein
LIKKASTDLRAGADVPKGRGLMKELCNVEVKISRSYILGKTDNLVYIAVTDDIYDQL